VAGVKVIIVGKAGIPGTVDRDAESEGQCPITSIMYRSLSP